jgi:hypothetical protein
MVSWIKLNHYLVFDCGLCMYLCICKTAMKYVNIIRVGIRKAKSNSCAIGFTKSLFTVVYCYRI